MQITSELSPEQSKQLKQLGIGENQYRILCLLPVVEVAWVDGKVQRGERKAILKAAAKRDLLEGGGETLVDRWLGSRPGRQYFEQGRKLLRELAGQPDAKRLTSQHLDEAIELCWDVAASAGGVLGVGSISQEERELVEDLIRELTKGRVTLGSRYVR